jgi:hypothetical protein
MVIAFAYRSNYLLMPFSVDHHSFLRALSKNLVILGPVATSDAVRRFSLRFYAE